MSDTNRIWRDVRKRLRGFQARSGWAGHEIGRALRKAYAASCMTNDMVARLLSPEAVNPRRPHGVAPIRALLRDYPDDVPPFAMWLGQFEVQRQVSDYWHKQDAITAIVVGHEETRAAQRRRWLALEGRRPDPPRDVLRELDAATIAILSGGTIVARGVRL